MKILIVRTFPNIIDPNQYNMQEIGLAKAFVRLGHVCDIVLFNGKNRDTIEKIEVANCGNNYVTIYKLHGYNFLKNGIFPSLNKIAHQYNIIQVHEYDQITSWLYYAWSKQNVVIYHGPYFDNFNKGYNLKCQIFDHTLLKIKNNTNVTCLTKSYEAADFLKVKGFINITSIGVGLDAEKLRSSQDRNSKLKINEIETSPEKFTWIYVGKLEERRNVTFLLDIVNQLLNRYNEMEFIMIGNGEDSYKEKCLKKIDTLLQKGKVRYYEQATQAELAVLYQQANAMLFPSLYDIFGMVLLEAMYFNLPVISSKNGGADMLIQNEKNGIVINEFNLDVWVSKAEQLYLNQKLYQNICENLEKRSKDYYMWDSIAKKSEKLFNKIIDEGLV